MYMIIKAINDHIYWQPEDLHRLYIVLVFGILCDIYCLLTELLT
jgi:hypothetical protein